MKQCSKNMYWVVYDKTTGCVVMDTARKDRDYVVHMKGEMDGGHWESTLDVMLIDVVKIR